MFVKSATGAVFAVSPGRGITQADIDARIKAGEWAEVMPASAEPEPAPEPKRRTRNARTGDAGAGE